jgi:hypothetical protein
MSNITAGPIRVLQELLLHGRMGYTWLLGHQAYGIDFQETRDRSVGDSSLYSYKLCKYPIVHPTPFSKGSLPYYQPQLFGEVYKVDVMVSILIRACYTSS